MYSPFFLIKYFNLLFLILLVSFFGIKSSFGQSIDEEEFLDRIESLESNVSDLQKGTIRSIEENLTPGYISRNETRLDKIETQNLETFGFFERNENKLLELEKKIELISSDLSIRIDDLEKLFENIKGEKNLTNNSENQVLNQKKLIEIDDQSEKNIDAKSKYENAIKLLWSNNYDEALKELQELKTLKPKDLMPNIQYWLGEVYYAKKDFDQAVLEFGEGLKNYPDSIKGPDNMLKLGLSFSNLSKKTEACNVLIELEFKYPDSAKDVLQRSIKERQKLGCNKE